MTQAPHTPEMVDMAELDSDNEEMIEEEGMGFMASQRSDNMESQPDEINDFIQVAIEPNQDNLFPEDEAWIRTPRRPR